MDYTKELVDHYVKYRNDYRSTDKIVFPLLEKYGVEGKNVLDFGCGDGTDSLKIINMGAKSVIGIDLSKAMIERAREIHTHSKIKYLVNHGRSLDIESNCVDFVFANFVIHYLKDTLSNFKEINRVLTPGGYFLAVMNCLTDDIAMINKTVPMVLGQGEKQTKIQIVSKSPEEIKNNLEKSGFKILEFFNLKNPHSQIDPNYENEFNFKKNPVLLVAKKVS